MLNKTFFSLLLISLLFLVSSTFASEHLRRSETNSNDRVLLSNKIEDYYIDPTFPNPKGSNDAPIIIYGYTPNFVFAVVAVAVFGAATLFHIIQACYFRIGWFSAVIIIGCIFEIVGYCFRILSSKRDPYRINYFIIQYFFIVVAPVFFSAAIYIVITKMIKVTGMKRVILPRWAILVIFILFDIATVAVQITGAALVGVALSDMKDATTGNTILLIGLAVQVGSFGFFLLILLVFICRFKPKKTGRPHVWRLVIAAMTISAMLIETRTVYRLVETSEGVYGHLSTNELYFAFLEFLPVILAVLVFNLVHPGYVLSKKNLARGQPKQSVDNTDAESEGRQNVQNGANLPYAPENRQ